MLSWHAPNVFKTNMPLLVVGNTAITSHVWNHKLPTHHLTTYHGIRRSIAAGIVMQIDKVDMDDNLVDTMTNWFTEGKRNHRTGRENNQSYHTICIRLRGPNEHFLFYIDRLFSQYSLKNEISSWLCEQCSVDFTCIIYA